jgi:hypothetical protein
MTRLGHQGQVFIMQSSAIIKKPMTETENLLANLSLVIELNQKVSMSDLNFTAVFIKNGDRFYPLAIDPNTLSSRKIKGGRYQFLCKFSYQMDEVRSFFQIFFSGNFHFVLDSSILNSIDSTAYINIVGYEHNTKVDEALGDIYLTLDDTSEYMSLNSLEHHVNVVNDKTL